MIGCIIMGLTANLPVALAPGMGMNAASVFVGAILLFILFIVSY
jgi:xanthine/uracil/vitamin C permease (AzgA family)